LCAAHIDSDEMLVTAARTVRREAATTIGLGLDAQGNARLPDVSVRAAWERLLPSGTALLGGEAGLDRVLGWPVVLRTHPPAFDPLRGGELAIVPLDRLHLLDDRLTLARVVTQLGRARVGALCAIGPVDHEAVGAADAAGLPLFQLPPEVNPAELQGSLMRQLAELRVQLSAQVSQIGRELSQLAIEGRGRAAIVRRAAQLAEATILLEEHDDAPVAQASTATTDVVVAGRVAARLLFVADRAPTSLDKAILEHAAAACQIDLAKEEAALAAKDELLGEFLDELLRGEFPSDEAVERRGRNLGYDLSRPHLVVALEAGESPERLAGRLEAIGSVGEPVIARAVDGAVIVLAPLADADGSALEEVVGRLAGSNGRAVAVGVGGVAAGPRKLALAADQALQALRIGQRVSGFGQVVRYEELGLYRLLFELRDAPSLPRFHDQMLAPLVEHDRRTNGELLRTLDAYLTAGCSPTAAAERLHLHRNGLLYRLQRIREILPVDLDDPEQRLGLHLALRIGAILPLPQEVSPSA
jgi:purine catabolism regulator